MRTGVVSRQPKDVSYREAIEDLETRPIYIRRAYLVSSPDGHAHWKHRLANPALVG
jgi:hypothetical protein